RHADVVRRQRTPGPAARARTLSPAPRILIARRRIPAARDPGVRHEASQPPSPDRSRQGRRHRPRGDPPLAARAHARLLIVVPTGRSGLPRIPAPPYSAAIPAVAGPRGRGRTSGESRVSRGGG